MVHIKTEVCVTKGTHNYSKNKTYFFEYEYIMVNTICTDVNHYDLWFLFISDLVLSSYANVFG